MDVPGMVPPAALDAVLLGASLLTGPGEVAVATDENRAIVWVSPTVVDAFGWSPEEFRHVCHDLIHPDDALIKDAMSERVRSQPGVRHVGVARHRARDGSWLWIEVVAVNLLASHGVVLTRFRDVTGTKQAEQALVDLAHDELTGLVTRRIVRQALEDRLRDAASVGVLFCDLDGFKELNDRYGHAEGDRQLEALGQRLRAWESERGAVVGRWGGDEFVAFADLRTDVLALAAEIARAVRGDDSVNLRASIGAVVSQPGEDALRVIQRADEAMYDAKRASARVG